MNKFKKLFSKEFNDSGESFLLLPLIPVNVLEKFIDNGVDMFYNTIKRY